MKIKSDYANAPQWKELTIKSRLPEELKCLDELAHNMWWAWNYEARDLFRDIDPKLYSAVKHNPVMLLERLGYERKEEIVNDKAMMKRIQAVYKSFKDYMNVKPDATRPSVAYFCMEYGIHSALKIYSGGLGMLAGDYVKEASDSNVDMCAIGFLYRFGYFTQTLSMDGQQIAKYEAQNFNSIPVERVLDAEGNPVVVDVPYTNYQVHASVWVANVGRVKLYPSYYEPWGYTPLEAVAFKVPCITTDLAGFGLWANGVKGGISTIEDGVEVIHRTDYNYSEVADRIKDTVCRYASFGAAEVKKARANAEKLSKKALWDKFIAYYLEAYDFALRSSENRNKLER